MRIEAVVYEQMMTAKGGSDLLKQLGTGARISAKVLELSASEALLRLSDGSVITATLKDNIDIQPGQLVELKLKDIIDGQLVMQLIGKDKLPDDVYLQLLSRLKSFSIPDTDENIKLGQEFTSLGIELTKETFLEAARAIASTGLDRAEAILLAANDLEPSPQNIQALNQLLTGRFKIDEQLRQLLSLLSSESKSGDSSSLINSSEAGIGENSSLLVSSEAGRDGNSSLIVSSEKVIVDNSSQTISSEAGIDENSSLTVSPEKVIVDNSSQTISSEAGIDENLSLIISSKTDTGENSSQIVPSKTGIGENSSQIVPPKADKDGNSSQIVSSETGTGDNALQVISTKTGMGKNSEQTLSVETGIADNSPQISSSETDTAVSKLKGALSELFADINSEDLEQKIDPDRLYRSISEHLDTIRNSALLSSQPVRQQLEAFIDRLDNTLRLLCEINNYNCFYQIPLRLPESTSTLELYVLKKGSRKRRINPEDTSVFLSLNTENLGQVDALISIDKFNMSVYFRAENDQIAEYFKAFHKELYTRLQRKGYKLVDYKIRKLEDRVNLLNIKQEVRKLANIDRVSIDYRL